MSQQTKFLYVEDDPLSREIMQMILTSLGYTNLTVFEDSADFQRRVEALTCPPDVFFLDIQVEPYDGIEMLRILRQYPSLSEKTVIALTASVMNEEVARLKNAGFDGAISKPLDFENFGSLIERVLAGEQVWHIS